jgi:hypothetical protein
VVPEILDTLWAHGIKWTSVEVFQIGYAGEVNLPIVLWVRVLPVTLTNKEETPLLAAGEAASACKEVLGGISGYGVFDVEYKLKESCIH